MIKDVNDSKPNEESKGLENSKALLVSVIIMGVLIIIGVVALIGVVAHRAFNHQVHRQNVTYEVPAGTVATLSLPLKKAQEEHIISVTARPDGNLAIALSSQNGNSRILLWAPEQARLIAELDLAEENQKKE